MTDSPYDRMLDTHEDDGWLEHGEWVETEKQDRLIRHAPFGDPKPARRHKATPNEWKQLRAALLPANCRVCDTQRAAHLHHVASKAQGGSDIRENLLPVCASCHDLIHGRSSWALAQVRDRITENPAMLDYLVRQKGWEWLNRAYPRWELAA